MEPPDEHTLRPPPSVRADIDGELAALLSELKLSHFANVFAQEQISLRTLQGLTHEALDRDLKELGLPMGPRRDIMAALLNWSDKRASEPNRQVTFSILQASNGSNLNLKTAQTAVLDASAWVPYQELQFEEKPLAAGMFGEVYRVTHAKAGSVYAAKVLKVSEAELDEEALGDFHFEAALLLKLRHPHVIACVGLSKDAHNQLVVLAEYMIGGGLNRWLYKLNHKFTELTRLRLASEIGAGMAYLHSQGVVHRDLKSDNILLDEDGAHAKVGDLGLAKARSPGTAYLQSMTGTLMYMAPEMLRNEAYGAPADVYSLALVLFELWTARRPYTQKQAANLDTIRAAVVLRGERPDDKEGALPAEVSSFVQQCWTSDPRDRPAMAMLAEWFRARADKIKLSTSAGAPAPSSTPSAVPPVPLAVSGVTPGGTSLAKVSSVSHIASSNTSSSSVANTSPSVSPTGSKVDATPSISTSSKSLLSRLPILGSRSSAHATSPMPGGPAPTAGRSSGASELAPVSVEFDASKPASVQFRAASEQLSSVVVAFIVLAHRGEGSNAELVNVMRKLVQLVKKMLIIANKRAESNHPELLARLISKAVNDIDAIRLDAVANEFAVAAGATAEHLIRKQLHTDTNGLRVLTLHVLASLSAYQEKVFSHLVLLQIVAALTTMTELAVRANDSCATYRRVAENTKKTVVGPPSAPRTDVPLYDEKKDPAQSELDWEIEMRDKNPRPIDGVAPCSFNRLISLLTSDKCVDITFIKTFFVTYRWFATPCLVLEKLAQRYNTPKAMPVERSIAIKLRVTSIIKSWVEYQCEDFDDELVQRVFEFCDDTLVADKQAGLAKQLKEAITTKLEQRMTRRNRLAEVPLTDLSVPNGSKSPAEVFLSMSEEDIARQLTLIDSQLFYAIEISELVEQAWAGKRLRHRAPNVCALTQRHARLATWLTALVLWHEKTADRASALTKLYRVADALFKLNNFHTLMALALALECQPLRKYLPKTQKQVSEKVIQNFHKMLPALSNLAHFKELRALQQRAKPPVLPFLSVYLADLTLICDGQSTLLAGRINWSKSQKFYAPIGEIEMHQQVAYSIAALEPIKTFLTELPGLADQDQYELSRLREPR